MTDAATVSVGLSIGTVITLVISLLSVSRRFGALELKVDTMWDFQMRRASTELVSRGFGSMNSPFILTPEALALYQGMATELKAFYARQGRHLSASDLALDIERMFGERINREICIPHGLVMGACLLMAVAVASGDQAVKVP